jgi:hypothetical protein
MKFFIDAGHRWASKDRGAVGYLNEEQICLEVANALSYILVTRGHQCAMTKIDEPVNSTTDSLRARVAQSDAYQPDLFVSIHANAYRDTPGVMGTEAFAITREGAVYAQAFIDNMVQLGFTRRTVKVGEEASHLYVLANTQDPAVLLELCFVDSKGDANLFNQVGAKKVALAIADAIAPAPAPQKVEITMPPKQFATADSAPPIKSLLVRDLVGKCDTGLIRGLSLQLIAKMNRMVPPEKQFLQLIKHPLINMGSAACNPYLQPKAAAALIRAVEKEGREITINSCFRTIPQQWLIRQQFEKGLCGITAAAQPDKSNHSGGVAIDIQKSESWENALEEQGWKWLGAWDAPHFDYWGLRTDIPRIQVSALQMLWNQHNPGDLLAIDGEYGSATGERLAKMPANGY